MARGGHVWELDVHADRDRWANLEPSDLPEELEPLRDPRELVRRFREYAAAVKGGATQPPAGCQIFPDPALFRQFADEAWAAMRRGCAF
jgi:hypothetical protein